MPGTDLVKRPSNPPVLPGTQKRESEALIPRAFRSLRRNRHISVPLAVPPGLWAAGEILHANGLSAETAAGGGALTVAVWFFAHHKWTDKDGNPRAPEVWYARLSATGATALLTAIAKFGATSGTSGEILGGALVAGSIAWGIPWWRHKRPRGMRRRQRMRAQWQAWWEGHCHAWSLDGSRVIDATETGVTIRLRVQLWAGRQSIQHVQQAVHLIESALEGLAEPGRVRVERAGRNGSQVDLFIKRENPLKEIVEWEPALAPASVHEQAVDGLTETGQWKTVPMRVNKFVIGRTRSGKSNDLLLLVAQLSGCPDDRQVVIDLKGGRSARPLLEAAAVDYVITDVDEARMYLLMLTQEIRARAMYAYTGEEQLHATEEMPAWHTLIDEVNGLTSVQNGDTECANHLATVASQGSGLEVYVAVYSQYGALEDSVRTEQTRSNLALRAAYAVEEPRHGEFAISEWHKFDASKLEERGTHLTKLGKTFPEQIRSPHMPHPLLKSISAANARKLAPRPRHQLACGDWACPAGGTWQEWWDRRWLRLEPAFRKISPQYREAASAVTGEVAEVPVPDESGVIIGPAQTVTIAPAPSAPGEGDGASVAARIDAETEGPDIPPPDKRAMARVATAMRQQKEAFADALAGASHGISPAQLQDESGMSSSWVHQMLAALTDRGAVTKIRRGLYAPVPGIDMHEAVRAVESGNDALLRDARQQIRRLQSVP